MWLVPGPSPDIARPEDAQKPALLVLVGPTASGKTEISLQLALTVGGEIVSADSRQVYKHLDIGTAKPSPAFRRAIPHHFVDDLLPDEEFSAGEFGLRGRRTIGEILARGKRPIVVGGSGLYVRSLIDGIFEGPGPNRQLRELLERKAETGGVGRILRSLAGSSVLWRSTTRPANRSPFCRSGIRRSSGLFPFSSVWSGTGRRSTGGSIDGVPR